MRNVWDSLEGTPFTQADQRGLVKLMSEVKSEARPKRHYMGAMIGSCVFMTLMCFMFIAGWHFSSMFKPAEKEVTLITSEGSVGDYVLPDGSRVRLNSSSTLTYYNDFSGDIRMVSLDGEGFFEVSKNPQKPFIVRMNNLEITVLGTSFDAKSYPEESVDRVILKSGAVSVACPDGSMTRMTPGQMLEYEKYEGILHREDVDADAICRWYEPCLEFDAETLENILSNISDRYRVDVEFRSETCPLTSRMSMTIKQEPVEKVLDVLCALFPIRYEIHPDDSIVIVDKK